MNFYWKTCYVSFEDEQPIVTQSDTEKLNTAYDAEKIAAWIMYNMPRWKTISFTDFYSVHFFHIHGCLTEGIERREKLVRMDCVYSAEDEADLEKMHQVMLNDLIGEYEYLSTLKDEHFGLTDFAKSMKSEILESVKEDEC